MESRNDLDGDRRRAPAVADLGESLVAPDLHQVVDRVTVVLGLHDHVLLAVDRVDHAARTARAAWAPPSRPVAGGVSSLTCGVASEPTANGARSCEQDVGSLERGVRRGAHDATAAQHDDLAGRQERARPRACLEVERAGRARAGWRRPPPTRRARCGRRRAAAGAWSPGPPPPAAARAATPPARAPMRPSSPADEDAHQYDRPAMVGATVRHGAIIVKRERTDQGGHARMQSSRRRVLIAVLVLLVVAQGAWIAYPRVRNVLFPPEETSAARGHRAGGLARLLRLPRAGRRGRRAQPRQQGGRGSGVHRADPDDVREEHRRSPRVRARRRAEAAA